ncbi:uncharacterized protein LOC131331748 isoform X4 [Rhododendron vialii]|uniref:uncharacterized protein LOC131331748 isoform X4 n=1 Tax=Rhododendron vialii TaxID=182163 RepID=UPI00265DB090|nr:uncharacterized protein LOC131331748 isoform X4 [Rhododendron vialii]
MDSNQLVNSLTAHISLYHSSSSAPHSLSSNPNHRSSILKWFSSLSVHQRQSHLAVVDPKFAQILLQMETKLRSNGHGAFIILPDVTDGLLGLPSLCYRRSRGLLARVSESNESERAIYESIRLFDSREGERAGECSCSAGCLDSVMVCEEFVENVDRFAGVMDGLSNGGFLRGEGGGLGEEWVELEWLKEKGYYGIEEFMANRLEVALRLSWLNCCSNGKKRGVRLKEKASAAGVAANVYWRKKGCVDWWEKLDASTRKNVFRVILGKSAKSLTAEILKMTKNSSLEDHKWLFSSGADRSMRFKSTMLPQRTIPTLPRTDGEICPSVRPASISGKPSSFANMFYGLSVLQEISSILLACQHGEFAKERVLFSSLPFVSTVSDCIFRKLRGLMMVVSLDCTKLELLEEVNSNLPMKKSKEKIGAASRRKKGRTRNIKSVNPIPRSSGDDARFDEAVKDQGYEFGHSKNIGFMELNGSVQKKVQDGEIPSSPVDMEPVKELVKRNVQIAARKSRKKSNAVKKYGLNDSIEGGNSQTRAIKVSSPPVISQCEAAMFEEVLENSISTGDEKLVLSSSPCTAGSTMEEKLVQRNEEDYIVGSSDGSSAGLNHCQNSGRGQDNHLTPYGSAAVNNIADSNMIPPLTSVVGLDDDLCKNDRDCRNCGHLSETDSKSVFSGARAKVVALKEKTTPIQEPISGSICDTEPANSPGCPSYEWPSVAPVPFSYVNSHLPAATDRLHLDVGHNWQNHFHHPFVPTMHQVRNPPTENGCSRILSRPMQMSLDWPPMVRNGCGLAPPVTRSYDSSHISRRQSSFHPGFAAQSYQNSGTTTDDEKIYSGDFVELTDTTNPHELTDEHDKHWISDDEYEVRAVTGMDYSQYFGGGVMYWDPSDHPGTSFSRPPSLSSDDSSWAWRDADMNRAVDDMVAFSSSYSTNGLASPSAAPFCAPFDPLAQGHQAVSYVIQGSEVTGKLLHSSSKMADVVTGENVSASLSSLSGDGEPKTGDSLPYPILRPIIIPSISRERSRDFKRSHDIKSPCVPPNRRDQPRIKRPPSPVVLCVPRAPRPPPPSPVGDCRKNRGFPTVRSGSSSPKHWGMRGLFHDSISFEEACVRMDGIEVFWPSWKTKSLTAHAMIQPPGALLQDHLIALSQLTRDQEHPDVAFPLQPPESLNCATRNASFSSMHSLLHDEIEAFCKQVAAENLMRKPYINWAVKRVARSLQVLWPRSRTNIYGSYATGLSLPTSDVDLVVCLPPVRNLEPIKEAGILEGRNGIKETCLQHAARYLANQEWVKNDSLKIVENTAIPIIMLVMEVPHDLVTHSTSTISTLKEEPTKVTREGDAPFQTNMVNLESSTSVKCSTMNHDDDKDMKSIRIDISFKSPSHTGLQTTELVKELTEQFPAATPLALVLKQFLADRSLDQSYSGGLSSYCLVLLITRFLQHEHHHGRLINQRL